MNEYCSDAQLESKQSQIYYIKAVTENKDKPQIKTIIGQLLGGSAENIFSSVDKSDEESGKDDDSRNDSANNWDRDQGMLIRCKGAKLNHAQIVFLWDKIFKMNSLINELSKQYKIAPSTLYKIQKLSKKDVIKLPRRSYQCATLNT